MKESSKVAIIVAIITGIFGVIGACVGLFGVFIEKAMDNSPPAAVVQAPAAANNQAVMPVTEPPTQNEQVANAAGALPQPAAAPDSLLFSDDFEQGLKPDWQPDFGEWRMTNGRLSVVQYVDERARIFVGEPGWTDYTVEFEGGTIGSNFYNGNSIAALVRAQDSSSYLWFAVFYTSIQCGLKNNGADTIMHEVKGDSFNTLGKGDHRFKVVITGNKYEFFLDDERHCFFEDNTFNAGRVGIWVKQGGDLGGGDPWIDNVKIRALN